MERVLHGDCLDELCVLEPCSVDLIYLDPPFFTNKVQKLTTRDGSKAFAYEDIWESQKEYAQFMYERLKAMKTVLKQSGSIFVHCDRNATHIIKSLLDEIFGVEQFRSEIIWYYRRWSNAKKGLLSAHQTIYFYSKSDTFTFNTLYTDYSETTNIDQILQKRAKDTKGKTVYAKDAEGTIICSDEKRGVPLGDVWEIPYLNPKAKERVGYPTQKPILLLERIIDIASNVGDTILDPFCGSGTTLVAGKLKNRHVIGIDSSLDAVTLTKERLANPIKSDSPLLTKGREAYQNSDTQLDKLLHGIAYIPVQRNSGIDAILKEQYQESPVLIRIQKEHESLEDAITALHRAVQSKNAKKAFLIRTNDIKSLFTHDVTQSGIEIVDAVAFGVKRVMEKNKQVTWTKNLA